MSILNVNKINPVGGGSTVTIAGIASVTNNISVGNSVTASEFHGDGSNLTSLPAQATISNNADNRVITGGSGVNLNGEANLTFSSNQLTVHTAKLKGNQLLFEPSGTAYIDHSTVGQDIQVRVSTSSSNDTTGPTFKSNGNLAFASGKGIDFSATADPSFGNTSNRQEVLDDYEEGQWAPEYSGATAAGSVSYSFRKGYYIKIGAQVTVWVELTVSSASGMSGATQISNLPFNKNELGGNGASGSGTYYYSGTTNWYIQNHSENKPIFTGWMPNSTNVIRIYNATHWGGVTHAPLNTTGRMSFSYTYTTSS